MFDYVDARDLEPPAVCRCCAETNALVHNETGTVIVHCRHFMTGGWIVPGCDWLTIANITAAAFLRRVVGLLTLPEMMITDALMDDDATLQ